MRSNIIIERLGSVIMQECLWKTNGVNSPPEFFGTEFMAHLFTVSYSSTITKVSTVLYWLPPYIQPGYGLQASSSCWTTDEHSVMVPQC